MKTKILYIEDEHSLGKIVKDTLEKSGYEVRWETDGARVMNSFELFSPDICIVDIMLPNIDGYTLSRNIRGLYSKLPIIFLTAKTETEDLVKGFEAGGTDYMKKPFSIEELIARIENQLAIHNGTRQESDVREEISLGKFSYLPGVLELKKGDETIKLSNREAEVLNILCANRNHITDRKNLLMCVWGDDSFFNSRNLDVYIRKLRQYFKDDPAVSIETLKGKGYLFLIDD
ncbi:MAG: response regulator transcription factor [Bacteroidales bacterium]|nr:response regulator transcription factor [Bacteroidales bacterium]